MNLSKSKNHTKIKAKKDLSLMSSTIRGDWLILISLLFVLLLASLIFSGLTYFSVKNQSFISESEAVQKSSLKVNTEQLDRVINNLNTKKEKFDNF